MKTIRTERLLLRPWREDDARALFEYAKNPNIGPAAGWPAHTSVEDSLRIIRDVLSREGTLAVTLLGDDTPIGSVGVFTTTAFEGCNDPEVGYWIAEPFWGMGYIPEAVRALLRHCFMTLSAERVWCSHYEGNVKSKRVIEKCGFRFAFDTEEEVPLLGEVRGASFYSISREAWSA
ncbi:MAG: GNAT family N-acetyltransferase [Oscillospiraceae bacterium]